MKTVLVLLGLLISFNCFGTEERERDQVRRESGRLFQANDFEALERIATLYRDDASRTSSGTWKLRNYWAWLRKERTGPMAARTRSL